MLCVCFPFAKGRSDDAVVEELILLSRSSITKLSDSHAREESQRPDLFVCFRFGFGGKGVLSFLGQKNQQHHV